LIDKIVDEEDDELGLSIPYEDDEEEEMDETKLGILKKFVLMQGSKCLFLRLSEYFLMREFLPNGRQWHPTSAEGFAHLLIKEYIRNNIKYN
jgi:hypothetical protein